MTFYLLGTNFKNKGAELMLHSVMQELNSWGLDEVRVAGDLTHGSTAQREKVGMEHLLWQRVKGTYAPAQLLNSVLPLVPKGVRRAKHIVTMGEVDALLDGSGFRLSSQFTDDLNIRRVENLRLVKNIGKKVILLPQAFGPFDREVPRKGMLEVLQLADLVFARDRQSLGYLQELGGDLSKVQLYPDFTNQLTVQLPAKYEFVKGKVLVVPNGRMLDRTSPEIAEAYIPFISSVITSLRARNIEPLILIHSAESDKELADRINSGLPKPVDTVQESDALVIKAIIGAAGMIVASRFHAVVSALSQATPALVCGWSHKYEELLSDYGSVEWLLDPIRDQAKLDANLDVLTDAAGYEAAVARLKERGVEQKALSKQMWGEVKKCLGVS